MEEGGIAIGNVSHPSTLINHNGTQSHRIVMLEFVQMQRRGDDVLTWLTITG